MAVDETDLEAGLPEAELAGAIFDMVDSVGDDDDEAGAGQHNGMLSRGELRKAFVGVPNFNRHAVEDFLYLFPLNEEGQIEREEFVKAAKRMEVLAHASTKE